MAAPANAYTGKRLNDKIGTTVIDHQYAIITPDIATMKARFYLDDVLVGVEGTGGVIGFCDVTGFNYQMHNPARRGSLNKHRETVSGNGQWRRYHSFRDGGLNTLAFAEWYLNQDPLTLFANYIISPFRGLSSFYDATTQYGFQHRKRNIGEWYTQSFGGKPQQTNWNEEVEVTPIEDIYVKNDIVEFRPYIVNPEGTYYGPIKYYPLQAKVNNYVTAKRASACDVSETNMKLWMKADTYASIQAFSSSVDMASGLFVYKDAKQTIPADAGWYAYLKQNDNTIVYNVNALGEIRRTQTCTYTPTTWVRIAGMQLPDGTYTPNIQLGKTFTGAITVTGNISELINGSLVQVISYSITVPAGQLSAMGTSYTPQNTGGNFLVASANASPLSVDSEVLNPVEIINL